MTNRIGIVNFRDIGGAKVLDGRVVNRGLWYRGAALNDATDADLAQLRRLGIGLIFDLRSTGESTGRPDRLPAGVAYRNVPAVRSLEETGQELLDWGRFVRQLNESAEVLAAVEYSQHGPDSIYAEMIRHPAAFNALFHELLARPDRPVYVHCSAGKDRTGVASALLLRLLGVARQDVLADYLLSAKNPLPDASGLLQMAGRQSPRIAEVLATMMGVSQWQFDLAWDEPERAWGGWGGFVGDGLGLSQADVARLRAAYLS